MSLHFITSLFLKRVKSLSQSSHQEHEADWRCGRGVLSLTLMEFWSKLLLELLLLLVRLERVWCLTREAAAIYTCPPRVPVRSGRAEGAVQGRRGAPPSLSRRLAGSATQDTGRQRPSFSAGIRLFKTSIFSPFYRSLFILLNFLIKFNIHSTPTVSNTSK